MAGDGSHRDVVRRQFGMQAARFEEHLSYLDDQDIVGWIPSHLARISDIAVVPYRQDQAPRLDFWGSAVRNDTREGDTLWVNYTWSHFSSRSTVS